MSRNSCWCRETSRHQHEIHRLGGESCPLPPTPIPRIIHHMMKKAVEVHDLVVVRGGREVLRSLDFTIGGGVTGLLGPSGCGKSTLMRALVGVQQLSRGTVRVFGTEAGSAPLRDRVGYVTQAASVYD